MDETGIGRILRVAYHGIQHKTGQWHGSSQHILHGTPCRSAINGIRRIHLSAGLRREKMNSPYAVDRASARRSMEYMLGRSMPLPGFVLDAMIRNSQNPAYAGFIHGYDPAEELDSVLAQVQTPTTIIWGEQDGLFPVSIAHEFHAGIPNADLVLLPHAAHMPQTQATRKVAQIIIRDAGMG